MGNLKNKSRGGNAGKWMPNIYFCAHPADMGRCVDLLSNKIFAKYPCSIWYDDDGKRTLSEDDKFNLCEMQAVIAFITRKFLTDKNYTHIEEVKFASERHIPVLPVLVEEGLEELFNREVGDFHLLSMVEGSREYAQFDMKLYDFLGTVFVGDELSERVRAEFDGYIFLSYRKKDRKHAASLMKMIHENVHFRDVAIWYDGFLVPGENFNDAIENSLKKSDMFALVVTPNLVNESNYVMKIEYPMAKDCNKLILPVELSKTDIGQLKQKYNGIPTPISKDNRRELDTSLVAAIKTFAKEKSQETPEHNFYIGLAYLYGIDVEINLSRAAELITDAAERGYTDASFKLMDMYIRGIAVERNPAAAIRYGDRLFAYFSDRVRKYYRGEDIEALLLTIDKMQVACFAGYSNQNMKKLADIYVSAYELMKRKRPDTVEAKKGLASLLVTIGGDVLATEYLPFREEEKIVLIQQAIELYEEIMAYVDVREDMAYAYNSLATKLSFEDENEEALEAAQTSLELFLGLSEYDEMKYAQYVADTYSLINMISNSLDGFADMMSGELDRDKESRAISAYEMYVKMTKLDPTKGASLVSACFDLSDIYCYANLHSKAAEMYKKTINELKRSGASTHAQTIASLYKNLALVYSQMGRSTDAVACQCEAASIYEGLYRYDAHEYAQTLCELLIDIAYAKRREVDMDEAVEYAERAYNVIRPTIGDQIGMSDLFGPVYDNNDVAAHAANVLSLMYAECGQINNAINASLDEIELWEKVLEYMPRDTFAKREYYLAIMECAKLLAHSERHDHAKNYACTAINNAWECADMIAYPDDLDDLPMFEAVDIYNDILKFACSFGEIELKKSQVWNVFDVLKPVLESQQRLFADREGIIYIGVARLYCLYARICIEMNDGKMASQCIEDAEMTFKRFEDASDDTERDMEMLRAAKNALDASGYKKGFFGGRFRR